jgi:hypothetical protein
VDEDEKPAFMDDVFTSTKVEKEAKKDKREEDEETVDDSRNNYIVINNCLSG